MTRDAAMVVVRLRAVCELEPHGAGRWDFSVAEFAVLQSGDYVLLRDGLGWTVEARGGTPGTERLPDPGTFLDNARGVVGPDDDDGPAEEHPWELLSSLARQRGLSVSAAQLRAVPYDFAVSDRLLGVFVPEDDP